MATCQPFRKRLSQVVGAVGLRGLQVDQVRKRHQQRHAREQIITEWLSRFLGEDECTQNLCGHVDPAFLFSSQASTKIKGPESQFGTRILGFYILTKWIR